MGYRSKNKLAKCGSCSLAKRSKRSYKKKRSRSPSAGWSKMSPKLISQRRKMKRVCGSKCFLQPGKLAYPICPKGSCKINCKGLSAAYVRSRQWKKPHVSAKAKKMLKSKCKRSVGKKRSKKSKKSKKRSMRCKYGVNKITKKCLKSPRKKY